MALKKPELTAAIQESLQDYVDGSGGFNHSAVANECAGKCLEMENQQLQR